MADESPEEPFKEDLPDWIGQVEDRAWLAARDAAVSRFVLGNLVLELGQRGAIDAGRFIARLQAVAPLHPDPPHQQAIEEFLVELQRCLPAPDAGGGGGAPGAPRVFH